MLWQVQTHTERVLVLMAERPEPAWDVGGGDGALANWQVDLGSGASSQPVGQEAGALAPSIN